MNDSETQYCQQHKKPEGRRLNRWLTLAAQPGWLLGLIVKVRQSAALTRAD